MSDSSAPRPQLGPVPALLGGLALTLLWPLPFVVASAWIHPGVTVVVGAIGGVALGVALLSRYHVRLYAAMLVCIPAMGVGAYHVPNYLSLRNAERVELADVALIGEHPDVDVFTLPGSEARGELRAWVVRGNPTSPADSSYAAAAPIVGPSWTPGQPVHAWAIYSVTGRFATAEYWEQDLAARALPRWEDGGGHWRDVAHESEEFYREAVAAAAQLHGLTPTEGCRLLSWISDPDAEANESLAIVGYAFGATALAWLLGAPLVTLFRGTRKSKSQRKRERKQRQRQKQKQQRRKQTGNG